MCGRFGLFSPSDVLGDLFCIDHMPTVQPRYNIAPSQHILAVCQRELHQPRSASFFTWGLVPRWAKKRDFKLINARGETIAEKPAFRNAFRSRRCLIPVDGFFEWKKIGRDKVPHFFRMKNRKPFAIAGIYEPEEKPVGPASMSCALVTTEANDILRPVHQRMPVIIAQEDFDSWLSRENRDAKRLLPFVRPFDTEAMEGYPVGKAVNSASYDAPDCIEPIPAESEPGERSLFD